MKIIFLDIDGVLNSRETAVAIGKITGKPVGYGPVFIIEGEPFTRENLNWGKRLVENLRYIVEATRAKIVITSTWRLKFPMTIQFKQMFDAYDWFNVPIIGVTAINMSSRGVEIEEWMAEFQSFGNKIEEYVILDDEQDFSQDQMKKLILIDNRVGLTHEDANLAIAHLIDPHDKEN